MENAIPPIKVQTIAYQSHILFFFLSVRINNNSNVGITITARMVFPSNVLYAKKPVGEYIE